MIRRNGSELPEHEVELFRDLARQAMESGELVQSDDGLHVAVPIRKSEGDPAVGAVATLWTSAPFLKTIADYHQLQIIDSIIALAVLIFGAAVLIRYMVSAPIVRVEARASKMAEGDLQSEVPGLDRKGEIGGLAGSMERLRSTLQDAEVAAQAAFYESAGFNASSAAQILCDDQFKVVSANAEFAHFMTAIGLDDLDYIGASTDVFGVPDLEASSLAATDFPLRREFSFQDRTLAVTVKSVVSDGEEKGCVVEWQDVSQQKVNESILQALEEGLLRADFDGHGAFISATERTQSLIGSAQVPGFDQFVTSADDADALADVRGGQTYFGRFRIETAQGRRTPGRQHQPDPGCRGQRDPDRHPGQRRHGGRGGSCGCT